ncbi:MAG: ribosome maturation factor RimP, partial [Candidatus Nanopelagicaceae bacterium]
MALKDQIFELLDPLVSKAGLVLEEVQVQTPGKHRFVTIIVDSETGLNLDQVTEASRAIGEVMDGARFMGETPYTLEVTSPGVDRPLTAPRHWRKNVDRLVKVSKHDGEVFKARIISADEDHATLDNGPIDYADVKRAIIEVEFNKKDSR